MHELLLASQISIYVQSLTQSKETKSAPRAASWHGKMITRKRTGISKETRSHLGCDIFNQLLAVQCRALKTAIRIAG